MRGLLLSVVVLASAATAAAAAPGTAFYGCRTYTSQHPVPIVRPTSIVIACADANQYLTGAHWSSWSATSASGLATMHENTCTPSCAAGTFRTYRVRVTLAKAIQCRDHRVFSTIAWRALVTRPHGSGSTAFTCLSR